MIKNLIKIYYINFIFIIEKNMEKDTKRKNVKETTQKKVDTKKTKNEEKVASFEALRKTKEASYVSLLLILWLVMLILSNTLTIGKLSTQMKVTNIATQNYVVKEVAKVKMNNKWIEEKMNVLWNQLDNIEATIDDANYRKIDELINNEKYRNYMETSLMNTYE